MEWRANIPIFVFFYIQFLSGELTVVIGKIICEFGDTWIRNIFWGVLKVTFKNIMHIFIVFMLIKIYIHGI